MGGQHPVIIYALYFTKSLLYSREYILPEAFAARAVAGLHSGVVWSSDQRRTEDMSPPNSKMVVIQRIDVRSSANDVYHNRIRRGALDHFPGSDDDEVLGCCRSEHGDLDGGSGEPRCFSDSDD